MKCFKAANIFLLVLFFVPHVCFSLPTDTGVINFKLSYLEDSTKNSELKDVINKSFKPTSSTPNFGLTKSAFWLKIFVDNNTTDSVLLLKINSGTLADARFYTVLKDRITIDSIRDITPYHLRSLNTQFPLFYIKLAPGASGTYYLRVLSKGAVDLPILIDRELSILERINQDQLFFGIYSGIILIMFLYNIFLYLIVKDKNYLYYVLYILIIGITQASLKGYAAKFLWPFNPWLIIQAPNLAIALSGIFSILFVNNFLRLEIYAKNLRKVLIAAAVFYIIGICITISNRLMEAQQLLQIIAGLTSITILIAGIFVLKKGYKPALFFNISWSFFLISVIIYILKDAGVLPFNNFTNNVILIGSGIEVALLSFALADRINTYKKEKEESQAEALRVATENERIIREQNVFLETKVHERTKELRIANDDLNKAMKELKDAEGHLVESEKMASLGQLTAGIAHEINNPINFVTSNVTPLKRDVDTLVDVINRFEAVALSADSTEIKKDQIEKYKEEVDFDYLKIEINHLIKGIAEGASRTAEIVKGLRVFSRIDEDDLKRADINDGLDSTLIITNNLMRQVELVKEFSDIPVIECYPGKLNQVFLNIITNAIHAVNKRYGENPGGILTISTANTANAIQVKIKDNGTGMDESTKKKIFEPFFTTKEVGEGTGLGMSIAYNIIKKHNGKITINSELGIGTEFILELPLMHKL